MNNLIYKLQCLVGYHAWEFLGTVVEVSHGDAYIYQCATCSKARLVHEYLGGV